MPRILIILALLIAPTVGKPELTVEFPARAFGYSIGDLLVQRVQLNAYDNQDPVLDPILDENKRIGHFLSRLSSDIVEIGNTQWLEVHYQLINAPTSVQSLSLPSISFATKLGQTIESPSWQFIAGPLLPTSAPNQIPMLLADHSATSFLKEPNTKSLMVNLVAILLVLGSWLLWWTWRQRHDNRNLPFSEANIRIRKLTKALKKDDSLVWIELHRAFNRTAGKLIGIGTVDELIAVAPWLKIHESAIKDFYSASNERFYQNPATTRPVAVPNLCQQLAKLEKAQAKPQANSRA